MSAFSLALVIAFIALSVRIAAEVTVLKIVQAIYNNSSKLRIRGSGGDTAGWLTLSSQRVQVADALLDTTGDVADNSVKTNVQNPVTSKVNAALLAPMTVDPGYLHQQYVMGNVPDLLDSRGAIITSEDQCSLTNPDDAQLLSRVKLAFQGEGDVMKERNVDSDGKLLHIFCGIYNTQANHNTKVRATRSTWAKKCDGFIAFSTFEDTTIPSINTIHEGPEAYDNMWQKSRSIWKYINTHLKDKYDFFLLGGDDMFYIVENLRAYLGSKEITQQRKEGNGLYLGRTFQPPNQIAFNSGGAGYLLDVKALTQLGNNIDSPKCFPHQHGFWEDVNVANCLRQSTPSIVPYDTRDTAQRERFHPFTPAQHLSYRIPRNPDWYAKYHPHLKIGFECCSEESISFHYIQEVLLYKLYNYVYHCKSVPRKKIDYCTGLGDPFANLPVDTFHPPRDADDTLVSQWRAAQQAMSSKISHARFGGEQLRELIRTEVEALQALRFSLFCKFVEGGEGNQGDSKNGQYQNVQPLQGVAAATAVQSTPMPTRQSFPTLKRIYRSTPPVFAPVVAPHEALLTVIETVRVQRLYSDELFLIILGSGFNPVGNMLRWSNGLLGNNVNYTTVSTAETEIKLRLVPGSNWRNNLGNLPVPLTLLAINAGAGFVAMGPLNSGKGRDVAMIFERPAVFSSNAKLLRTTSYKLNIKGQGFPELTTGFKPALKFNSDIQEGIDYTIMVLERTEIQITLRVGKAWRADAGALIVTQINTRGDTTGWVTLPGQGVHVADVMLNTDDLMSKNTYTVAPTTASYNLHTISHSAAPSSSPTGSLLLLSVLVNGMLIGVVGVYCLTQLRNWCFAKKRLDLLATMPSKRIIRPRYVVDDLMC